MSAFAVQQQPTESLIWFRVSSFNDESLVSLRISASQNSAILRSSASGCWTSSVQRLWAEPTVSDLGRRSDLNGPRESIVPSSPGFIGTYHVAVAYALEIMGVEPAVAASVAIAGHFMATVPWTIIGLFVTLPTIRGVWKRGPRPSQRSETALGA